jgi:hypothetical protein
VRWWVHPATCSHTSGWERRHCSVTDLLCDRGHINCHSYTGRYAATNLHRDLRLNRYFGKYPAAGWHGAAEQYAGPHGDPVAVGNINACAANIHAGLTIASATNTNACPTKIYPEPYVN